MAIIELKKISKVYSNDGVETPVLHDVSFEIEKGECVAIMGPSGSGKSTLLHILGFLDRHTSGTYKFDGKTIDDLSDDEIAQVRNKKMGFIFQAFNLLSRTSVLENVKLPLLYADVKEEDRESIATRAIESVGLMHRLNYESSQLSGGEKQRTAIARALVCSPDIIFADEPTGNLDSKSGQTVMEILQKLNDEWGHTILLITHETQTAEHAKRIIRVRDGGIESDIKVKNRRYAKDSFAK